MRIVILSESFAEGMGYAGMTIPKTMRQLGADVHFVTAGLPIYHHMSDFKETYGAFQKPPYPVGTVTELNGYPVHVVDHRRTPVGIRMGLRNKLAELQPQIVQTFAHAAWPALDAAMLRKRIGYKLFTGNHTTASVYPLATMDAGLFNPARIKEYLIRTLPGRYVSSQTELCYGATVDCSDVAHRFMGVPLEKLKTIPLGVETDVFHPAKDVAERDAARALRRSLGVHDEEIMCVYSGRFTDDKNPLLLAQAVEDLRAADEPYRAVFFGEGVQRDAIAACEGAIVHPFVHYTQLADLYRGADIGVWPTQESTSMIDCSACGTPIVVNDTIAAVERVEGNGLRYRLNDRTDLKRALLELKSVDRRQELGDFGARKMEDQYSWRALVQIRLDDYAAALAKSSR